MSLVLSCCGPTTCISRLLTQSFPVLFFSRPPPSDVVRLLSTLVFSPTGASVGDKSRAVSPRSDPASACRSQPQLTRPLRRRRRRRRRRPSPRPCLWAPPAARRHRRGARGGGQPCLDPGMTSRIRHLVTTRRRSAPRPA